MPHKTAPKIEFSARARKIIEEIVRQRSTEYRLVVRASMILAMADGAGNHELTRTQNLDRGTARYWRGRWIELTFDSPISTKLLIPARRRKNRSNRFSP